MNATSAQERSRSKPPVDGAVALVTGSGRDRVGRRIALRLAERGYRLVLHANASIDEAREVAEQLTGQGHVAIALAADLREETAVAEMVDAAVQRFGRIDALVNTAAVWIRKPLEAVTAADVRLHFEINALGTFLSCQKVGLTMTGQPTGGAIVNLGDWATVRPYTDYAAYFPSKGAVEALTRSMAVELAARNPRVRVNAVLPGPVMLPIEMPADERAASIAGTLVEREGSPDHVADAVVFLLENDFVTGVCLPVDGGRTLKS